MTAIFLFIIVAYLEVTHSQYYGQPPLTPYQPYSYYSPVSTPPVPQALHAPPPISAYPPMPTFTQPPMFAPPSPFPESFAPTTPALPTYVPSTLPPLPMYLPPPMYASPTPTIPSASMYTPVPPTKSKYPTTVAGYLTKSTSPKRPTVGSSALKCNPPTAIAYYVTTQQETSKAAAIKEKVKESLTEKPLPTYPCPFCTGFANVPKNPKVPPPPPCSSVLPGILDKIPTIAIPEEFKLKDLRKIEKPLPLLSDLFKNKLSGKLRFDQDLLDGFLTGLGLEKYCEL